MTISIFPQLVCMTSEIGSLSYHRCSTHRERSLLFHSAGLCSKTHSLPLSGSGFVLWHSEDEPRSFRRVQRRKYLGGAGAVPSEGVRFGTAAGIATRGHRGRRKSQVCTCFESSLLSWRKKMKIRKLIKGRENSFPIGFYCCHYLLPSL